jgi:hypothetical protein
MDKEEFLNKRRENLRDFWLNLKPFQTIDEIPDLPKTNEKEWREFYIPILIKCGAIPKNKLIVGKTYIGACRNATEALWSGTKFYYDRHKFNTTFKEEINHFEDDDGYDLFVPIELKY